MSILVNLLVITFYPIKLWNEVLDPFYRTLLLLKFTLCKAIQFYLLGTSQKWSFKIDKPNFFCSLKVLSKNIFECFFS